MTQHRTEPARQTPVCGDFDWVLPGGGSAGSATLQSHLEDSGAYLGPSW